MLPKTLRYFRPREINLVRKKGKTLRGDCFFLSYLPAEQKKAMVVVSLKVSKSAVVRNRLRRQTYSFLGKIWQEIPPALIIISFKPNAAKINFSQVEADLNQKINELSTQITKT